MTPAHVSVMDAKTAPRFCTLPLGGIKPLCAQQVVQTIDED
jgi:hypothetical protein